MTRKDRLDLIRAIENKRKSKVVSYITSDRQGLIGMIGGDVIPVIERHLRALSSRRGGKLDLFLYSRGGDSNVPWSLVSLIREYFSDRKFSVLIPFRAHSAATVIALGSDEIVMCRSGELGPIDATIPSGPHNPIEDKTGQRLPISVEDAMGFFNLLETLGLETDDQKLQAFGHLSNNVHPLALGSVSRLLSQTQLVAKALLGNRRKPLSAAKIEHVVKQLSSEIYSHEHTIRFREAKEIGLDFVKSGEEEDIENEIWSLFEFYSDFLHLNEPFAPNDDLIVSGDDEKTWEDLPIACVESAHRMDICSLNLRVRRLRDVPATVNLNFSNLQLAIPPIPDGLDEAQVQNYINQVVSEIVENQIRVSAEEVTNNLIKNLPSKGFEHVQFDTSWKQSS